ncbi:ABC transporter ATP-binding protein [Corynebacterium flavescens]|uniref:ABC transporter ATP-binding protein n=1 Tax=Corynebacterium flavescens TaxID=28028 RepID=UPI003FD5D9BE
MRGFGWTHAGRVQPALRNIDLSIAPGERVLLCGDSGSGKSTLVAALAGVLGGDDEGTQHGEIILEDAAGNCEAPGRTIPVGLVLQDPDSQVICSRVGDDVAFGCENLGVERSELWERVNRALDMVGLDVDVDHPTARLSGGQKQRLALAGVMAMGARLILLDEPTANLDPQGSREVAGAVAAVAKETGATLVVVEHNYEYWADILDRAIVLEHGELVEDATPAAVVARRQITGLPHARSVTSKEDAMWCNNLVTRFGPPRTYQLPAGSSTVVSGANGSGKTTWLMTMAGLLPAQSGEIGLSDSVRDGLSGSPAKWPSRELARHIGFVFQNPEHQFVARSVHEELRVSARARGVEPPEQRISELVDRLRLGQLLEANPFALSGGEKRRLSVATALVTAPAVVLLDEPTFGQDPSTFAELVRLLRELADSGVTVASISHDPYFISALGDHRIEVSSA